MELHILQENAYDKDLCIFIFKCLKFFKSDSGSNIWRLFKACEHVEIIIATCKTNKSLK